MAIQSHAQDKKQKEQLSQPSTEFFIQKSFIERKALFGDKNAEKLKGKHPEVFAKQEEDQKAPKQINNIIHRYDQMMENTKLKKVYSQTDTVLPFAWKHDNKPARVLNKDNQ